MIEQAPSEGKRLFLGGKLTPDMLMEDYYLDGDEYRQLMMVEAVMRNVEIRSEGLFHELAENEGGEVKGWLVILKDGASVGLRARFLKFCPLFTTLGRGMVEVRPSGRALRVWTCCHLWDEGMRERYREMMKEDLFREARQEAFGLAAECCSGNYTDTVSST